MMRRVEQGAVSAFGAGRIMLALERAAADQPIMAGLTATFGAPLYLTAFRLVRDEARLGHATPWVCPAIAAATGTAIAARVIRNRLPVTKQIPVLAAPARSGTASPSWLAEAAPPGLPHQAGMVRPSRHRTAPCRPASVLAARGRHGVP